MKYLRAVLPLLRPADRTAWSLFVFSLLAMVATRGLGLATPFLFKSSVDALAPAQGTGNLPLFLILAYGGSRLMAQLFYYARIHLFEAWLARSMDAIRLRVFAHLQNLSLRFHLERQTGSLPLLIQRGLNGLRFLMDQAAFNALPTLIEFLLVCLLFMRLYPWRYTLLILVIGGLYIIVTWFMTRRRVRIQRQLNSADDYAGTLMLDALLNYETVKLFGKEEKEQARYASARQEASASHLTNLGNWHIQLITQGTLIAASLCLAMLFAAEDVTAGALTIGDYVLINTYMLQLFAPLGALANTYIEARRSLIDLEAMVALLGTEPEIRDAPGAKPLQIKDGEIRFDHVSFAYDPQRPILNGISFTAAPGTTTALVGPTGAGKSTIARLLARFYDVMSGHILIDGQDISTVTQASLRATIGIVPQDPVLFNDTLGFNIAYGAADPEVSPEELEKAVRLAQLQPFINALPEAYETKVGERGLKLSGGEKQRMAIARVLLKQPAILILDEATSALDTMTEAALQACLRDAAHHCTTLIIAHRLSTITHADQILVLDRGVIVEHGTHDTLLRQEGLYARLWRRQAKENDSHLA